MRVTRKQTLRSLSLSYPQKDWRAGAPFGMTTAKTLRCVSCDVRHMSSHLIDNKFLCCDNDKAAIKFMWCLCWVLFCFLFCLYDDILRRDSGSYINYGNGQKPNLCPIDPFIGWRKSAKPFDVHFSWICIRVLSAKCCIFFLSIFFSHLLTAWANNQNNSMYSVQHLSLSMYISNESGSVLVCWLVIPSQPILPRPLVLWPWFSHFSLTAWANENAWVFTHLPRWKFASPFAPKFIMWRHSVMSHDVTTSYCDATCHIICHVTQVGPDIFP